MRLDVSSKNIVKYTSSCVIEVKYVIGAHFPAPIAAIVPKADSFSALLILFTSLAARL